MKKVATIIVSYNGEKWIHRCLESLKSSDYPNDIFLVDNHSDDSTVSTAEEFEISSIQKLDHNSGFGFANNIALKQALEADYDYYFLINQDLYVESKTLKQLINFSHEKPEFGIIAPIQFDGKGENIDFNFQQYIHQSKDFTNFYETKFCNAAAWLMTKECLQKVGFFSPHFPHYGEDRNFCERALFHDFKIGILKNTKVLHDRSQSMSVNKAIKLGKLKLLSIFLNPNYSPQKSKIEGLKNALGINKFIYKKHKSVKAFSPLLKEYFRLLKNRKYWESEKEKQKKPLSF